MKVLGITGGVGAGKSAVLSYLEAHYPVRVIQADMAGHLVQEPGGECYDQIIETFGEAVRREDGTIDRGRLAEAVFGDREKLQKLNGIVHPAVKEYILREIREERSRGEKELAVVEAALFFEERYDLFCDEVWYVFADEAARTRRLMASRGYSEEKVKRIMANQMKEEEFRRRCKFVIDNSGDFVENTYEQIDRGLVQRRLIGS